MCLNVLECWTRLPHHDNLFPTSNTKVSPRNVGTTKDYLKLMSDQKSILVVGQNMFFLPRIQNAADALGYTVRQARTESDFWERYQDTKTILVLVDLEGDEETWPKVVEGLKKKAAADVRVVAFGPHSDEAGMAKAIELGCDQVVSKGEFSRDLPKILAMSESG